MRRVSLALLSVLLGGALFGTRANQARPAQELQIYFIDTEGGQATLFVAPSGESALVDAGNPGGRDTDRIMLALQDAGVRQIDHVVITHYHGDHIGGLEALAGRIPIKHFYDHGDNVDAREQAPGFQAWYRAYYPAQKIPHTVAVPGDRIQIAGLDWRIVTAAGKAIQTALAGAPGAGRANPECAAFAPKANNGDENGQSTGSVIAFGKFRMIDLGDLYWNNEFDLACPNNKIGTVDVYLTTHHGLDWSGAPALVHALQPRVVIQNNGPRKGGYKETFKTVYSSPGLEDLWQLHWAEYGTAEYNPPGMFIANLSPTERMTTVLTTPLPDPGPQRVGGAAPAAAAQPAPPLGQPPVAPRGAGFGADPNAAHTPAFWIKVVAHADGGFSVTNARNSFAKTYAPRAK